jgi:hypothetical protein
MGLLDLARDELRAEVLAATPSRSRLRRTPAAISAASLLSEAITERKQAEQTLIGGQKAANLN